MNAIDVLRYGQGTLLGALEHAPEDILDQPGACGVWSIREIIAHLASYESVLVDILGSVTGSSPTPVLDRFRAIPDFNQVEVDARQASSMQDLLAELGDSHERSLRIASTIDPETLRQPGTIPWYGAEYALDDLIVYQYYGHKREHSAQIESFRAPLAKYG